MRMIRYKEMIVGSSNQYNKLILSDYQDCQFSLTTNELSEKMIMLSNKWEIDITYNILYEGLMELWELLKLLKKKDDIIIKLRLNKNDYRCMNITSITDEILDMADVIIDKNKICINKYTSR